MSKKKSKCNIYYHKNDKANIYIEIEDLSDCCFEIWDIEGDTKSRAKVKIPVKEWQEMLKNWVLENIKKEDSYEYI